MQRLSLKRELVCFYSCAMHGGALGSQKRVLDTSALELRWVVTCWMGLVATELGSCGTAMGSLTHQASTAAHGVFSLCLNGSIVVST